MAAGIQKAWSTTAATNASADANVNMAEGMSPAALNDGVRAIMAAIKGWANQLGGAKTSAGAANVQTYTSDSAAAISTAYAAGMRFTFKAGYSNSGAATLNVDGVGAKSIKKGGAQSALAANDIVANGIYDVVYEASGDCFILLNPETGQGSAGFQPLDATLTALAALSWSSGSPVVQFTAADTVSLTLTPSVSSVTASQGAANTTPSGTLTNTADATPVRVLRLDGDRATPTQYDEAYVAHYLSNGAGTQIEYARTKWNALAITAGAEEAALIFSLRSSGTLADRYVFAATALRPNSNDGAALGAATTGWSDAFFASGGVINWNNGAFTLTQTAGALEASGTFRGRVALSSETGTPTSASANKKMVLTGGATINTGTADDFYLLDPGTSNRTITRGSGMTMYVNGTDSATATLAANQIGAVHYRSASVVVLTGAFS